MKPYSTPETVIYEGNEKFSCREILGRGSFGKVHAFCDASDEPRFAVKCPHAENTVFAREFQREVSNVHMISSLLQREKENIYFDNDKLFVKLIFFSWDEKLKANVYEYIDGFDLFTYLELKGALSFSEIIPIAYQLLTAVDFLQRNGLIHFDLKPGNIMRRSNGLITIIDLGSMHIISSETPLTKGDYKITRSYRSPENTFSFPDQSQSDVWSVGAILAELFLGETLFGISQKETGLLPRWNLVLGPLPENFLKRMNVVVRRQTLSAFSSRNYQTQEQIRGLVRQAEGEHTLLCFEHGQAGVMASDKSLFTKVFLKRKSFWKRLFDSNLQKKYFEDLVWDALQYLPGERKNAAQLLESPLFKEVFQESSDFSEKEGAKFCPRTSCWSCLRGKNRYTVTKSSPSHNLYEGV